MRIGCHAFCAVQNGLTVRRGLSQLSLGHCATCAGPILNHYRLSESLLQLRLQSACNQVRQPAWSEADQNADGFGRIILRSGRGGCQGAKRRGRTGARTTQEFAFERSGESRVGKECVSRGRFGWEAKSSKK